MQSGACKEKEDAAGTGYMALQKLAFSDHTSLAVWASVFIPLSFLCFLSRNEAPILMRPRFLSFTKMQLICKKSSRVTWLIASS